MSEEKPTYEELEQQLAQAREKWEEIKKDFLILRKDKEPPADATLVAVEEQQIQALQSYFQEATALFQLIAYHPLELPVIKKEARALLKKAEKIVGHSLK